MRPAVGTVALKSPLMGLGLVALCLGAAIALTDPAPATLPLRTRHCLEARSWRSSSLSRTTTRHAVSEATDRRD